MRSKRMDDFSSQVHADVDKDIKHQDVISDQSLDRVKDHGGEMSKGGVAAVTVLSGFGMWCILGIKNMFTDYIAQVKEFGSLVGPQMKPFSQCLPPLTRVNTIFWIGVAAVIGMAAYTSWLKTSRRGLAALDGMKDKNDYRKDNHIMFLSEMLDKYDIYPDLGASADIMPTGLMAHIMLKNNGVKPITLNKFDGLDPIEGAGKKVPLIDTDMQADFYATSQTPKKYQTPVDPSKERDFKGEPTMADYINKHWTFDSEIEPQRPAGAYIVNTAPINVILIAMTRAGKGQTYIEFMIDLWMRCNKDIRPNIIINDPKGELLVKKYVTANMRGFRPWRIDLLNPLATDIYNPLWDATQFARDKDYISAAALVANIGSVFFPDTGGEKLWTEGPKASFERMAYILIYEGLKRERIMLKEKAKNPNKSKTGAFLTPDEIDDVYGTVTLLEVYKSFNTLANTTVKNPKIALTQQYAQYVDSKTGQFLPEYKDKANEYQEKLELLKPIIDLFDTFDDPNKTTALDLYCAAIRKFPRVGVISEIVNSHDSLKAMAKADKTISSVYGIALSSLKFFTDRTVSALTSGLPSQNINIQSFAFPRRIGMQFDATYARRNHLIGKLTKFEAFKDPYCTESLGKKFQHSDIISMFYWTNFFFEGMLSDVDLETIYIKCDILSETNKELIDTFYFKFKKGYKHDYNGRHYTLNPVTGDKIAQDGIVSEYRLFTNKQGKTLIINNPSEYKYIDINGGDVMRPVFQNLTAKYQEGQNIMWLVTPPNMATYARLVLIMLKQLIDSNFGLAYMTKDNQKPMYPTMFMLDELGNLKSDGAGIQGLDTDLSIGLGQGQHFTLILQTLAQFTSVYGDDVEPILQSNSSQLTFLKSNDTQMLERLEKLSGTVHRMHLTGGSVSEDRARIIRRGESNINYNWSFEAEPCVTFNDMAQLPERNAITFNAGDSVVWARNDTALPMSWKLFSNSINDGEKYALKTLPNMSTVKHVDYGAIDFDCIKFVEDTLTRLLYLEEATVETERFFAHGGHLQFDSGDKAIRIDDSLDELVQKSDWWFDVNQSSLVYNHKEPTEKDINQIKKAQAVAPRPKLSADVERAATTPTMPSNGSDFVVEPSVFTNMVRDVKIAFIEAVCFAYPNLNKVEDLSNIPCDYYLDKPEQGMSKITGTIRNKGTDYLFLTIRLDGGGKIDDETVAKLLKEIRVGSTLRMACQTVRDGDEQAGLELRDTIIAASNVTGKYISGYLKANKHLFYTKGKDKELFIKTFMSAMRPDAK